jgi:peptidoglycan/LPS O-acetylase OafA/YrhL
LLALTVVRLWLGGRLGNPGYFALYFVSALAMTLALSAASYQWLEKPFLVLKTRFTHVASRPV